MKQPVLQRILLLLIRISLILFLITFILILLKNKQSRVITKETNVEFENEISSLIKLKTNSLKQIVYDYTFWTEFTEKINTPKDTFWYENNISTILKSFHLDYVSVYDTTYKLIHEASIENSIIHNLISKGVLKKLKETKFLDYFMLTDTNIIQISCATVHPNEDPNHIKTPPEGFFFAAKIWNKEFINELSVLSFANIFLSTDSLNYSKINKNSIHAEVKLYDYNNSNIVNIKFVKESKLSKYFNRISIAMQIIMGIALVLVFFIIIYTFQKWVNKPLKIVQNILKTEDKSQIEKLYKYDTEFNLIADLYGNFIKQKEELIISKEKAEESDKLKTAFINNISHEIRTPFNGILGFLSIVLENNVSDDEKRKCIDVIDRSSRRLIETINNIIEFSNIQTSKQQINYSDINVVDFLNKLYDNYKIYIENKDIDFLLNIQTIENTLTLHTDFSKLQSVLNALIKNAIKFTKKGFIEIGAELNNDNITFYIKDTGIGIPYDVKDKIYKSFTQADISDTRAYEGNGLGLNIAKYYAELLRGNIWHENNLPEGTIFYFSIPL